MKNTLPIGIMAILIASATAAFSQTAYTSRTSFDSAIAGFSIKHALAFDSQADGSYAGYYGKFSAWGTGLDSDGSTYAYFSPIATAAYTTTSAANSFGTDLDKQFLAGNSDSITFSFTGPVHAFGTYLIGNPSPTGSPAIAFWKMQANTPTLFDAFSATDPINTLSSGNDRYFLGIVSPEPFTQVTLFSDNDPAAVFSFNLDDISYATNAQSVTLSQVKGLPQGSIVKIADTRVARALSGRMSSSFYVQDSAGIKGIRVNGYGANRGEALDFSGTVTMTSDDEVAIALDEILSQTAATPPWTLGMKSRSLGGKTTAGNQLGIPDSIGPNNIGLDVCITGKITEVHYDPYPYGPGSWIIVDDGAARKCDGTTMTGVRVVGAIGADHRTVGDYVVVRGSSSILLGTDQHYPTVIVAQAQDVSP